MKFYIVLFHHRHGVDVWPSFGDDEPDEDEIIEKLRKEGTWDESDDNRSDTYVGVVGPFQTPEPEAK